MGTFEHSKAVQCSNDPGVIGRVWFTFVDVDRLDVQWETPKGNDDEGLRIQKYEVELKMLKGGAMISVETYMLQDLEKLKQSFTGLKCNTEYRVRVRAWNKYAVASAAAGPWVYSQYRKTRGCPLASTPSSLTVGH